MLEILQHFTIAGSQLEGNIEMLESPAECGRLVNYVVLRGGG